ncbi:VTT domain-containing protein [Candidatus Woesearchaeota archaeon]|nr:VTT domain-containing protein [Nanoarchaeota archaeon]MCB9370625.1 VTT domain-containing protein [Candidatus Woesearchaeota archaeon]USN43709.1 MAG: VTT domain-containing protein [Candidatus Woesearchaeota archaeon]
MGEDYYLEVEEGSNLRLPSNTKTSSRQRSSDKKFSLLKWIFIVILLLFLYVNYNNVALFFLYLMTLHPTLYQNYLFIEHQIVSNTLLGMFFIATLGSLFFLLLPLEALFIYYLDSSLHASYVILGVVLAGSMLAMSFNYFFGRILGERVLRWMFKRNFEKYEDKIDNYGGYVLFFGSILPGPIELLAVFFGGFKFPFSRYFYLVFMGRLIKFLLLFIAYSFFWDSIIFYYDGVLESFGVLGELW